MAFPLLALLPALEKILDKVIPDSAAAEKAKAELIATATNQEFQLALAQIQTNQEEAKSGNTYASSWRPTVGYICAVGLAYNFVIYPLLLWWAAMYRPEFVPPPVLDDGLMELVLGMLGMAGLRSWEKSKNIAR